MSRGTIAELATLGISPNVYVDDQLYVAAENDYTRRYSVFQRLPVVAVGDLLAWLERPPTKLVAVAEPPVLAEIRPVLEARLGPRAFLTTSLPYMLEIGNPHVTKGSGLAFVAESGLGKDAYDAFGKWLSKLRGSLAIVSTFACAAFGAVTGSSAANIVTIGGISIPEMKRYGYSKTLRTGTIASASILANLIPPSMSCIVYSVLTRVSIGQLFMAIIIPGVILTLMYVGTIYVWARIRPGAAAPIDIKYSWGDRFKALRFPIPIAVIFLVMIMGIYEGWFSPTEAGGIGAATVFIVVLAMRRMSRGVFIRGMGNALRMTGMIMIIVIGAFTIMYTMTMTRIADVMGDIVLGWGLGPVFIVIFVAVLFIIGGFALQSLPLVILFLPLFFPLVTEAGWNEVWFGVFIVILMEIALVTPPMAGNIYITDLLDDEANTTDIIKGVIPFYIAAMVLLALMIAFPIIATFLPSTMH